MISTVMKFDTLAWAKRLEKAGIPYPHAEAQVELISNVVKDNICTKQDLSELEKKSALRFKELELKITEAKNETIRWFMGTFVVSIGVFATVIRLFFA
jgi:hypothetical protein